MHTDSGMTGISLSGFMPYMTVASLEMSDEPSFNWTAIFQNELLFIMKAFKPRHILGIWVYFSS